MSYMDVLWIKIANSYSKWPHISYTQSLSLCGHSSIELCNTSTGKSAAAFRRDRFKLSTLGCLYLQPLFHGENWSFQHVSASAHKARTTQQWPETNVPDFISTSDWPSASPDLNPLDYKLWSKASGDGLQVDTSQYWKFKAISSEGSCRFSCWCVA